MTYSQAPALGVQELQRSLRLIEGLERDRSLGEPRNLRQRVQALDDIDAYLSDGLDSQPIETILHQRAKAIRAKLESVNFGIYESIRRDIQRGAGGGRLLEWMPDWNSAASLMNCRGYDYLDELISGVLQFEEPAAEVVQLESEMVSYQPTPARHILDLIVRTSLTERDFLIDLGSGLGHVPLLASICTGANCIGIELEPSYIDCARKSARSLNLNNAKFVHGDVRAADLFAGTVFYLYTPFSGTILRDVLNLLRQEAATRNIRVCTFGPCTPVVAEEQWLSVIGPPEADRVAIFRSHV
ncbi:MAG TPA: class I SAM-dependent methyltransferase [Candidatus Dormibacteraeota bacterium]|nr:class I SAM-dependent methyltransferase [Candidatus Dormibacteraeota bacterium]